ncbi:MAG: adenine phosphoribosyltransferase [Planctomycetota bacterium]|nr:adenine phosphoribosyltransferase [Planctomycetota bacterium]
MIERFIRDVPDFPKPGILFKDITPLLQDSAAFSQCIDQLIGLVPSSSYDVVCGIESRGFLFGAPLALRTGKGFVPIRKPGKLPYKSVSQSYDLEYGTDRIEIHVDAVKRGQRVLLVDDVLATGGTMGAAVKLVRQIGGDVVATAFVIELMFLNGRQRLADVPVHSLVKY